MYLGGPPCNQLSSCRLFFTGAGPDLDLLAPARRHLRHLAGARVVAVVDPEGEEIEVDDARSLPEMACI